MWARLRAQISRLLFVLSRRRLDDDTRLEIDAHLEQLTDRYVRQGMSADEAYLAARRQFGSTTRMRQDIHEMNSIEWIEQGLQDIRYGLRQLRFSAGYSLVVVATLGLGIGGATAVFSVVQGVLLAALPYEDSGQLVRFYQQEPDKPDTRGILAGTHFSFLRAQTKSFEDVAAIANYRETGLDVFTGGRAERLRVLRVSSGYFAVLRAQPVLGHAFDLGDEAGTQRVVLSHETWRSRFNGDPSIVGTTIRLSGEPYEVVGIARPGFDDPIAPGVDAWIPYALAKDTYEENNSLSAIGRLRNGVSVENARAELSTLTQPMRARWPRAKQSAIVATPLHEELVAVARGPLHLVFAAVAVVLLLACVNVANLALVRATGRVQEFAVRAALGSSRSRLARQLLIESLVLALLGGAIGLVLSDAGIRVLQVLGRDALPRLGHVGLNADVLIFALAATAVTAIAFGVAPALRLSGTRPADALALQSRSSTGARQLGRIRVALAATQVALALTLLAGAGILLASFHRLQQVDVGVRVDRVLTFEINLPTARYDQTRRASIQEELARRLETIPGVVAAGAVSRLPATGSYHPWNTHVRTGPFAGHAIDQSRFAMQQRVISGDLFAALGIPILAGRNFDEQDHADAPGRAIVSANFARAGFPGLPPESVLGQRIAVAGRELAIVGVVGDVTLDVYGAPTMVVYHAHRQYAGNRNWALMQVVAAAQSPNSLLAAVREEIARLDPELVVHRPATMEEVINRGTSRERFALLLMGAFAALALALAALGLYGVLAYAVRQRSAEIGIRIALGATAAHVRALVFRQAAVIVGVGVAGGLAGAIVLGRWLAVLTFEIAPSDPRILTASAIVLAVVALVATWLPARRASRVDARIVMHEGH